MENVYEVNGYLGLLVLFVVALMCFIFSNNYGLN